MVYTVKVVAIHDWGDLFILLLIPLEFLFHSFPTKMTLKIVAFIWTDEFERAFKILRSY